MTKSGNPPPFGRFDDRVDRELRGGLAALRASDVPPSRDPAVLARLRGTAVGTLAEAPAAEALPVGIAAIDDHHIPRPEGGGDLMIRLFRPAVHAPLGAGLLYIHGGGMIRGSVGREHAAAARMAVVSGAVVVSVEYRLAPEHPYPAAIDDCYLALQWLDREADHLGIDRDRVAIGGGSAGGGLAAALAIMARDLGGPAICFQFLSSPMLDDRTGQGGLPEFEDIPGWNAAMNRFAWGCVLGDEAGKTAVPIYAAAGRLADFAGLPPTFLSIGQLEIFRDEGLAFAAGLVRAGVPVELHLYPGAYHGWEPLNPQAELSRRSAAARDRAVRAALQAGHDKEIRQ